MDNSKPQTKLIDCIVASIVTGFCFGVLLGSFYDDIGLLVGVCLLTGAFGVTLACMRAPLSLYVVLGIFACVVGYERYIVSIPRDVLRGSIGEQVTLIGIAESVSVKENQTQFVLTGGSGRVLVSSSKSTVAYGDEVRVQGVLEKPKNFITDQGTEFDYVSYLYKDDILYRISFARISVVSHGHGNSLVYQLLRVRDWLEDGFKSVFQPMQSELIAGIVLGSKQSLSVELRNELITTGTIHIVALSGYNVSIVAEELRVLLARLSLGPLVSLVGGVLGIIFFILMTGAQSSAIRAGVMAVIALSARQTGHIYSATRALIVACFCMLVWNPKYLVYDVSFALSFLATLGIIFLTPNFEKTFSFIPKRILRVPLREMVAVTLGAQLAVLPYIVYRMGTLSLVTLPANLLVIPSIPYIMGFGTLSGLLSQLSPYIALPFVYVTQMLVGYGLSVIHFFARLPYASVSMHTRSLWVCLGLYVVLVYWVKHEHSKEQSSAF